jgi:hypothetical protein|tara:strand:+ start:425 stop:1222 length:798 start_codon:yes stop_codon:yes gene_type:complete
MTIKERFTAVILDCETHMKSVSNKLIYHIAWVRGDIRSPNKPRRYREFYVREFLPFRFWEHTYPNKEDTGRRSFWKNDSRAHSVQQTALAKPHLIKSWNEIVERLNYDLSVADGFGTYNWAFDASAIDITNRKLHHKGIMRNLDIPKFCLMDWYVTKVINRDYFLFIDKLSKEDKIAYLSKSGKNLGHSAEVMARYMMQDPNYKESHLALDDATVEMELLENAMLRTDKFKEWKKDFLNNPRPVSWQSVKARLTATQKTEKRKKA